MLLPQTFSRFQQQCIASILQFLKFSQEVIGSLELAPPVLDIGCGNGLFAAYCYKKRIDIGLDYDENALKEAAQRGVYDKLELQDARSLNFDDNTFQTVVSVCAIEHISQLGRVLSGVNRILKKDGEFIFTVPSEDFANFLFGPTLLRSLGLKSLAKEYGERRISEAAISMSIRRPTGKRG